MSMSTIETQTFLNTKCSAIAKSFHAAGEAVVVTGEDWRRDFRLSNGMVFTVCQSQRSVGRLTIDGHYPLGRNNVYMASPRYGEEPNPSITVDAEKDPAKIVTDIQRRFLPAFTKRWYEVVAKINQANAHEDKVSNLQDRIVRQIAGARAAERSSCEIYTPSPYFSVRANSDSVEMKFFSMPVELAEKVIAVVEAWRKEHSEEE